MLSIEPLAGYVVCGASSLVAAAMMQFVRPDETRLRQAMTISTVAFLLLGVGLFHLLFTGPYPGPVAMWFTLQMTFMCVPMFSLVLSRLTGQVLIQQRNVIWVISVGTTLTAAASLIGDLAPGRGMVIAGTVGALMMVLACWPFVVRPRHIVERALAITVMGYFASWLLRSAYTFSYQGPRLVHELYVPAGLQSWFAIAYATLPIVMASLLLNTVTLRLHQQLKTRASTDELTGVLMRRALRELAPAAVASAQAAGRELALLMLDLDRFKTINDQHGHLAGDEVLRHTAEVLRQQLRPDALLGPFGGEEFIVLVAVDKVAAARTVAERLRLALAQSPCVMDGGQRIAVTLSIGVAMLGPAEGLDSALLRSDEALYRAKRAGRDRVEVALVVAS